LNAPPAAEPRDGAVSDVQYDVTVTDTTTGQMKTCHNPAGTLASVADTHAFQ
jgi:hypothetical protein